MEEGSLFLFHRRQVAVRQSRATVAGLASSTGFAELAQTFFTNVLRGHLRYFLDRVTTRNLKVLKVDAENHLLVVRGAVPGPNGNYVLIRKAVAA